MAMNYETMIANTLVDLARAAHNASISWALIGGEALTAHDVPRQSVGVDLLVPPTSLQRLATILVDSFNWIPVEYEAETRGHFAAESIAVYDMDDPVLAEIGEHRQLIPLRSYTGITVTLYAAQHPIEAEIVEAALIRDHHHVRICVAPLGGVLLLKAKLGRMLDLAAIEQTAEHRPRAPLEEAIAWAERRDPATAAQIRSIVDEVKRRMTPLRTVPAQRRARP